MPAQETILCRGREGMELVLFIDTAQVEWQKEELLNG
jgi:hypothetical protein